MVKGCVASKISGSMDANFIFNRLPTQTDMFYTDLYKFTAEFSIPMSLFTLRLLFKY